MSRTVSPATGRAYGLARVARVWRLSRATLYRHRAPDGAAASPRPARCGEARSGPAPMPSWSGTSARGSSARACTARATGRSGPGCAMPASAPPPGGSGA